MTGLPLVGYNRAMRTIYFHEDDRSQIELLPLTCWQHCKNQMQKIDGFAEQRRAEVGWTPCTCGQSADGVLRQKLLT